LNSEKQTLEEILSEKDKDIEGWKQRLNEHEKQRAKMIEDLKKTYEDMGKSRMEMALKDAQSQFDRERAQLEAQAQISQ
jgi:hypothetical protein